MLDGGCAAALDAQGLGSTSLGAGARRAAITAAELTACHFLLQDHQGAGRQLSE